MLNVYALFEDLQQQHQQQAIMTSCLISSVHFQIRNVGMKSPPCRGMSVGSASKFLLSGDGTAGETKPSDEEASSGKAVRYRLAY
jgi:hypothetical protein